VRGSLRVQHLELCTVHRLLCARHLALRPAHRLLHARCFPLCASITDCSVFAAWLAVPVYGLLRTLTLCARVRAADRSAPSLEFRTVHRLLCARYLTFRPARGLLRVPSSTPCVARGLLRAQHLEFPVYLGSLRLRLSLRPVPGLLRVRHLALCSTYGLLRTFHSCPVLVADCSVLNTYCSALGPSGIPYSTPQVKLFRFT
jgi:hypothetical protein